MIDHENAGGSTRAEDGWAPPPYDLSGQRILVTGGAGGIGAATVRLCARLGAEVLVTDAADCGAVVDAVTGSGARASGRTSDLRDPNAGRDIADWAGAVDAVIMVAGLYKPIDWLSDDWEGVTQDTLNINLIAPIRLARSVIDGMAERGGGRMVLVGSMAVSTGGSFPGVGPHYAVSKGGVHTLVRWLAANYGPKGVLVNGVAPGTVDTNMTAVHDLAPAISRQPLKRAARPEEIAWPIVFLCTPGASFISGTVLDVNGGNHMKP